MVERAWRSTMQMVSTPLFVHAADDRIVYANAACCRLAGLSMAELIGKPYHEVLPAVAGSLEPARGDAAAGEGGTVAAQQELYAAETHRLPVGDGALSLRLLHPVHEEIRRAPELHALARIVRRLEDGVLVVDASGTVSFANPAAARLLGWGEQELADRSLEAVLRIDVGGREAVLEAVRQASSLRLLFVGRIEAFHPASSLEIAVDPVFEGSSGRQVVTLRDQSRLVVARAHLSGLARFTERLSAATDEQEVARIALDAAEALVSAEVAGIAEPDGEGYRYRWIRGELAPGSGAVAMLQPRSLRVGIAATVLRTGRPEHCLDYQNCPCGADAWRRAGVQRAIAVPLIDRGDLLGVLAVGRRDDGLEDGDALTLETLGRHVGTALGRCRLLDRARRAEAGMQRLVASIPDAVFELATPSGRPEDLALTYASPRLHELLGVDAGAELLQRPGELFLRASEREHAGAVVADLLRRCGEGRFVADLRHRDGGGRRVAVRLRAEAEGEGLRCYGVASDISALAEAEQRAAGAKEALHSIVDHLADGLVVIDSGGLVRYLNAAAERLLGRPAERLLGSSFGLPVGEDRPGELTLLHPDQPVVVEMRSASAQWDDRPARIVSLRDVSERAAADQARRDAAKRLREVLIEAVEAFALALEKRDPYTAGHQRRVAGLAVAIGKHRGLSDEEQLALRLGGLIHDIGKIAVPAEILTRPGAISDLEMALIREHPRVGAEIIQGVDFPWPVATMVRQHHERLDGRGYPDGLTGDAIIAPARILAVADMVEAIASHRPYRPARGVDLALRIVGELAGSALDTEVVAACISLFREEGYRFEEA